MEGDAAEAPLRAAAAEEVGWGLRLAQAAFVVGCVALLIQYLQARRARAPVHGNTGRTAVAGL